LLCRTFRARLRFQHQSVSGSADGAFFRHDRWQSRARGRNRRDLHGRRGATPALHSGPHDHGRLLRYHDRGCDRRGERAGHRRQLL
jgi:hypothetical protein